METFEASEFSELTFDSDFESLLGLPATLGATSEAPQYSGLASQNRHQGQCSSKDSGVQCPGCMKYTADLDQQEKEFTVNFQFLKKKVINTDMLIRGFKAKKEESDAKSKTIEELKQKLEQQTRDSSILSDQRNCAMENLKPLQEEKVKLEQDVLSKSKQVQQLMDRLEAEEAFRSQRSAFDERYRNMENEVTVFKRRNHTLTVKNHSLEASLKTWKREHKSLSSTNNIIRKRLEVVSAALFKAQGMFKSCWNQLKLAGLIKGEKRPHIVPNGYKAVVKKLAEERAKSRGMTLDDQLQEVDDSDDEDDKGSDECSSISGNQGWVGEDKTVEEEDDCVDAAKLQESLEKLAVHASPKKMVVDKEKSVAGEVEKKAENQVIANNTNGNIREEENLSREKIEMKGKGDKRTESTNNLINSEESSLSSLSSTDADSDGDDEIKDVKIRQVTHESRQATHESRQAKKSLDEIFSVFSFDTILDPLSPLPQTPRPDSVKNTPVNVDDENCSELICESTALSSLQVCASLQSDSQDNGDNMKFSDTQSSPQACTKNVACMQTTPAASPDFNRENPLTQSALNDSISPNVQEILSPSRQRHRRYKVSSQTELQNSPGVAVPSNEEKNSGNSFRSRTRSQCNSLGFSIENILDRREIARLESVVFDLDKVVFAAHHESTMSRSDSESHSSRTDIKISASAVARDECLDSDEEKSISVTVAHSENKKCDSEIEQMSHLSSGTAVSVGDIGPGHDKNETSPTGFCEVPSKHTSDSGNENLSAAAEQHDERKNEGNCMSTIASVTSDPGSMLTSSAPNNRDGKPNHFSSAHNSCQQLMASSGTSNDQEEDDSPAKQPQLVSQGWATRHEKCKTKSSRSAPSLEFKTPLKRCGLTRNHPLNDSDSSGSELSVFSARRAGRTRKRRMKKLAQPEEGTKNSSESRDSENESFNLEECRQDKEGENCVLEGRSGAVREINQKISSANVREISEKLRCADGAVKQISSTVLEKSQRVLRPRKFSQLSDSSVSGTAHVQNPELQSSVKRLRRSSRLSESSSADPDVGTKEADVSNSALAIEIKIHEPPARTQRLRRSSRLNENCMADTEIDVLEPGKEVKALHIAQSSLQTHRKHKSPGECSVATEKGGNSEQLEESEDKRQGVTPSKKENEILLTVTRSLRMSKRLSESGDTPEVDENKERKDTACKTQTGTLVDSVLQHQDKNGGQTLMTGNLRCEKKKVTDRRDNVSHSAIGKKLNESMSPEDVKHMDPHLIRLRTTQMERASQQLSRMLRQAKSSYTAKREKTPLKNVMEAGSRKRSQTVTRISWTNRTNTIGKKQLNLVAGTSIKKKKEIGDPDTSGLSSDSENGTVSKQSNTPKPSSCDLHLNTETDKTKKVKLVSSSASVVENNYLISAESKVKRRQGRSRKAVNMCVRNQEMISTSSTSDDERNIHSSTRSEEELLLKDKSKYRTRTANEGEKSGDKGQQARGEREESHVCDVICDMKKEKDNPSAENCDTINLAHSKHYSKAQGNSLCFLSDITEPADSSVGSTVHVSGEGGTGRQEAKLAPDTSSCETVFCFKTSLNSAFSVVKSPRGLVQSENTVWQQASATSVGLSLSSPSFPIRNTSNVVSSKAETETDPQALPGADGKRAAKFTKPKSQQKDSKTKFIVKLDVGLPGTPTVSHNHLQIKSSCQITNLSDQNILEKPFTPSSATTKSSHLTFNVVTSAQSDLSTVSELQSHEVEQSLTGPSQYNISEILTEPACGSRRSQEELTQGSEHNSSTHQILPPEAKSNKDEVPQVCRKRMSHLRSLLPAQESSVQSGLIPSSQPPNRKETCKLPVMRKRKLSFSAPEPRAAERLPVPSSLMHIFQFFELPPLLSPLPPSPSPCDETGGPLVKFDSATPVDVVRVMPLSRSRVSNTATDSGSRPMILSQQMSGARRQSSLVVKTSVGSSIKNLKRSLEGSQIDQSSSGKKQKLARPNGLSLTQAAIQHQLSQFLTVPDTEVKVMLDLMLNHIGKESKTAWELLLPTVMQSMECESEDVQRHLLSACEKKESIKCAFVSQREARIAQLLTALLRMDKELSVSSVMGQVWAAIFNKDATSQHVRLSLCRLFTCLCLHQGDLEQVRVLVYKIAWCGYLDLGPPLMAIVGVWPHVLGSSQTVSHSAIRRVLELMLRETYKEHLDVFKKVCVVMSHICQWDVEKVHHQPEDLLQTLLQQLLHFLQNSLHGAQTDLTFEVVKALELLLVHQGSAWTGNHFIQRSLVSVATRWDNTGGTKDGHVPEYVISLLGVVRAILAVEPLTKSAIKTLLGQVFSRLPKRKIVNMTVELAFVETLLEMSPSCPEKCLTILKDWQVKNKAIVPPQTFSHLLQACSILTQQITSTKESVTRKR